PFLGSRRAELANLVPFTASEPPGECGPQGSVAGPSCIDGFVVLIAGVETLTVLGRGTTVGRTEKKRPPTRASAPPQTSRSTITVVTINRRRPGGCGVAYS